MHHTDCLRAGSAAAVAAGRKSSLCHATPSPVPTEVRPVSNHQIIRTQPKRQCTGLYGGSFGPALYFAGQPMLNTGRQLIAWSKASDTGVARFKSSMLATYRGKGKERLRLPPFTMRGRLRCGGRLMQYVRERLQRSSYGNKNDVPASSSRSGGRPSADRSYCTQS